MDFYPRKNSRAKSAVRRAIREMKQLVCNGECCSRWVCADGSIDSANSTGDCIVVVSRQRFSAINADVYVRRVCAEYLDGSQAQVLTSAVFGKTWQEVLCYRVWGVENVSIMDLHSLIADVCFCMLKCGSTVREALMSASLRENLSHEALVSASLREKSACGAQVSACVRWNWEQETKMSGYTCEDSVPKMPTSACIFEDLAHEASANVCKRGDPAFDANMCSSVWADDRADFNRRDAQILRVAGMCALEQLAISVGWLKVLNKRADEIFIAEASRLQKYAS